MFAFVTLARLVAILALVLPLFSGNRYENTPLHLPYGYYVLLRWVICAVLSFAAVYSYELRKTAWIWILGFTAVIFNPLVPLNLGKPLWHFIDGLTALLFVASFFALRGPKEKL
jgi:hypothetical protein